MCALHAYIRLYIYIYIYIYTYIYIYIFKRIACSRPEVEKCAYVGRVIQTPARATRHSLTLVMHTHTQVHTYIRIWIHTYSHTNTHIHSRTSTRIYSYANAHIHSRINTHMIIHKYTHTFTHKYKHAFTHRCTHTCIQNTQIHTFRCFATGSKLCFASFKGECKSMCIQDCTSLSLSAEMISMVGIVVLRACMCVAYMYMYACVYSRGEITQPSAHKWLDAFQVAKKHSCVSAFHMFGM